MSLTSAQAHLAVSILQLNLSPSSELVMVAQRSLQDVLREPNWTGATSNCPAFTPVNNADAQLRGQLDAMSEVYEHFCQYINSIIEDATLPMAVRQRAALMFRDGMRKLDASYNLPNEIISLLSPFPEA